MPETKIEMEHQHTSVGTLSGLVFSLKNFEVRYGFN